MNPRIICETMCHASRWGPTLGECPDMDAVGFGFKGN